jgi:hypothetical protein
MYGALLVFGGVDLLRAANRSGEILGRFSSGWTLAIGLYAVLAGAIGILCLRLLAGPAETVQRTLGGIEKRLAFSAVVRWALVLVLVALPSGVFLGRWGSSLVGPSLRTAVLLTCSLAAAFLLPGATPRFGRMLLAVLVSASIFVLAKHLVLVTGYPFKLGWSEGNRLWDYSLYFGRDRYILAEPFRYPSSLTPGRHGLWGLPFLIPGITIGAVRLWDAALWTIPYLLLGICVFAPRSGALSKTTRLGLALWGFLFLSQGPIYAPLVLSAVLLTLGYDRAKPGRSALFTFAACFYAGISRWTWMVAPAVWAGLLALLEASPEVPLVRRLSRPLLLGAAGLAGAALSYGFMAWAFPQPDPIYTTSLSQPLLWYRLLPSPTNPLGVLPGLVIAVGPAAGLAAWARGKRYLRWDGWQALGLGIALMGFLVAGLVASVKIGGGSNLHNLDMLLVTLVILAGISVKAIYGRLGVVPLDLGEAGRALIALTVAVVGWGAVRLGGPLILPSRDAVNHALDVVRQEVRRASAEGEVLFLDQRQLLTFGEVTGVPLVMEYELKDVVNQAMASNQAFFEGFYQDLARGRFSLIVSPPIETELRGRSHPFGEEDDAQVIYLYRPLLEYYVPVVRLDEVSVWLLRPRQPSDASGPAPAALLPGETGTP